MPNLRRGLIMLVLTASACGSSTSGGGGEGVDWKNYASGLRSRINSLAGNCSALQQEFDNAYANDSAQRSRTGDGNADLMSYIQNLLDDSGC